MGVSVNGGTPKSSILIGFSIINHPFWGTPIFGNTHMVVAIIRLNVEVQARDQTIIITNLSWQTANVIIGANTRYCS